MHSLPLSQEQGSLNLHDYIGILLRYKWLVLCCLVAGLALGVYVGSGSEPPPKYEALALIKAGRKGPGFLSTGITEERPFAEELLILRSRTFLERVAQRLKHEMELLSVNPPRPKPFTWLTWWWRGNEALAWATLTKATPVTNVMPVMLRDGQVSQEARSGVYTLVFTDAHTFVVAPEGREEFRTGELERPFTGWGFSFTVTGGQTAAGMRLVFRVRDLEEVITTLEKSLVLSPMTNTNFLQISTAAHDANRAKASVQTVIEEYIAFGRRHSEQETAQSLEYITRQLEVVQNNIEEHLNAVRDFKEKHPLASLTEDTRVLVNQNTPYEVQLRRECAPHPGDHPR